MKLHRERIAPQMFQYADFDDRGNVRWMSYLMYYHRANYRSSAINTDAGGFRYSHNGKGDVASVGERIPDGPVNILSGTSSALGVGATGDDKTLPSRLWSEHASSNPWLNMAGRSYSATQELLLFMFHRHLLPQVDNVVILSGFNELATSRLPAELRGDHGGFFFCGEFFDAMEGVKAQHRKANAKLKGNVKVDPVVVTDTAPHVLSTFIERAVADTERNLANWKLLTAPHGSRISYVLQPMSYWVRDEPAPEEKLLFDETDRISKMGTWEQLYGEVSTEQAHRDYAAALAAACERQSVEFVDLNGLMASALTPDTWAYVDRAHYTDLGHDIVARLLAESLSLK